VLNRKAETDPGRLRLRLILEKPTSVPDGAGGAERGWTATGIVAADVRPVRAGGARHGEGIPTWCCRRS
jgi:head-tail adaptor